MAAAYKFVTEAALFEVMTRKKPTFSDLYLIHQQGWEGAAEHVSHPQQIAWKSMCATQEGLAKGERWCKRAIWGNTLPAVKREWKSVDRLTSGAFVAMWRDRSRDALCPLSSANAAAAGSLRSNSLRLPTRTRPSHHIVSSARSVGNLGNSVSDAGQVCVPLRD